METVGTRRVYGNPALSIREDVIVSADGSADTCAVVDAADIALVIPIDGDRMHVVEQYRHPVNGRRWEFPSGSLEDHDLDTAAAAVRELREETGLSTGRLVPLGVLDVAPSTLSYRCHVFLAADLRPGAPDRDRAEHDMRAAWFTRLEVEQMLRDGTMRDSKSAAAYALLLLHEQQSA